MNMKSNGSGSTSLSVKERRAAGSLYNWETLIQKHFHDTVEVQTVMYFLYVAAKSEPVDVTTVAKELGLTRAAASRNFYRLSEGLREGADGLNLIEALPDAQDYRRKLLQVTPKGVEVVRELTSYLMNSFRRIENVVEE